MGRKKREHDHLNGLNEAQLKAAQHDEGAAALFTVPGGGKTFTIVCNIVELARRGTDLERLLAVTFTKAAAKEMNDRIGKMGVKVRKRKGDGGARVGTYHSLCLEIIRDDSPWSKYDVDAKDAMRFALKDIVGWRGMDWKGVDLTHVLGFIGRCKNNLVPPGEAAEWHEREGEFVDQRMIEAYALYEEERDRRGLLTFDDMLVLAVKWLRMSQSARGRWCGKYDHIIVDEFQDTNVAQAALMDILQAGAKSFLVVGDDDQLIYEWRGSKAELSTGFAERYGAEVFRAEKNYRSRPEILEAANAVIVHNDPNRVEKRNEATREPGGYVTFAPQPDMDGEAEYVCEQVRDYAGEFRWDEMAVLYRTNAQSRAFEEVFLREKIPHIVIGGQDFYSRKEVADILAYLKLAVNPGDDEACRRCINRPFRYVGKATLDKIERTAKRAGCSSFDVLTDGIDIGVRSNQQASLDRFVDLVLAIRRDLGLVGDDLPRDLPSVLSRIIRESGYEEWILRDEGSDTSENSRVSNLKELVRTSGRFKSAVEMLEHVEELRRMRKRKGRKVNAVKLMSIHKAKGLEWPIVFVAGACEGILPHARSDNEAEERRLFYVAITRAREQLHVTCPLEVDVSGRQTYMEPSRFVREAGLISQVDSEEVL